MRKPVLVVEDTEDNCQIIRDLLSSVGCVLIEAAMKPKGWHWCKAITPA
jgi:CheY-like chemotaxis protein